MKLASNIAGGLLGLIFIVFSGMFLLHMGPQPPAPPEGSPLAMFMGGFATTGYLTFVKVLELVGGILVVIPRLRNFGLLVLGPIIINILAFHQFVTGGHDLFSPPIILIVLLAGFLLWSGRKGFAGLME